jgi:PAS domain-containing protein
MRMINEDASSIPVKLLQGMLEGMSDGIVLTDSQEQVTFINQSAVRILGCREQIDGQGTDILS